MIEIAVLDDDPDFRLYLDDLLKDEGHYSVRSFPSPGDLFDGCELRPPEIVLLDMKMGEHSGEKVLDDLLARWPEMCVIVITGYPSLEDMRATFRRKAFDYLSKPFSLAQLRQTLKNAAEAFHLGRQPHDLLRERLGHRIKVLRAERDWSLKDLSAPPG